MTPYFVGFGALLVLAFAFLRTRGQAWMRPCLALAAIAVLATLAYLGLGAWRELRINELQLIAMAPEGGTQEQRAKLIELLTKKSSGAKGDPRYAYLLGHRLLLEQDYEAARNQFSALRTQAVSDFNLDLSFVQSDFLAREGQLGPDSRELAWELFESDNPLLLEILVLDSLRAGDQAAFLRAWPRYSATPRGAALARGLGQSPAVTDLSGLDQAAGPDETQGKAIEVELSASPGFDVPENTTVFVVARDTQSAGPPLAVRRLVFSDLPLRLVLSDADAMLDSRKLSDARQVEVVARIAFSGGPIAAQGDLEVSSGKLELGSERARVSLRLSPG